MMDALRQRPPVTNEDLVPQSSAQVQVSYLAVSAGDSKKVHHVSGAGWKRVSAIMDSGSAESAAPEDIARSVPLVETEGSRQGQTYHTADGGVVKNKGETQCPCKQRVVISFVRGIRTPM